MKYNHIPYSQQDLKNMFDYDPITGCLFWKIRKARCIRVGDLAGVYNKALKKRGSYVLLTLDRVQWFAHRIIWKWVYGEDPGEFQIDHRNGNGLDNSILNLRKCTPLENSFNKGLSASNLSGVKGVFRIRKGLLKAQVWAGGVRLEKLFSDDQEGMVAATEWAVTTRTTLHFQFANQG